MSIKRRLERELQDVAFSNVDRDRLKERLHQARQGQKQEQRQPKRVLERLSGFWNGSTEIPLPAGLLILLVASFGLWKACSTVFIVDQTTAAFLIQAGRDSTIVVMQGVSVL